MINESNNPYQTKNDSLLNDIFVYHSAFSICDVYDPGKAFLQLSESDLIEIDMVVEGHGTHCVFDREIPCKVGDIFVTPPNTSHGYFVEMSSDSLTVRRIAFCAAEWFDGDTAKIESPDYCYGVFNESAAVACAVLNASKMETIYTLYDEIESEIGERNKEWKNVVRGYLSILLINIARYVDVAIKDVSFILPKEWNTVLSAITAVKENYGDCDLTLESIADDLYISKSHLSNLFRKVTGSLFSDYLRKVRLDRACELLENTTMTVESIMKECGLRDTTSFYKNFSAYVHMTPKQYRQSLNLSEKISVENIKTTKEERIMIILSDISENLQKGKAKIVKELVQQAIDEGANPEQILNEGLLAGMNVIGEKFKNNEVYVPDVLVAARAMSMGTQILKPFLAATGVSATGKVCIGTVQGDLHDIGKNLVKMMMEGKGLEVVDLGTDVSAETFVQAAIDNECQVICCSALLTTTMGVMADVVKAAEAAGIRDKVKIMVGGAPVNTEFCKEIGADCYTVDAASAADAAVEFCRS